MITKEFANFDLQQIAQSGQCFRMNPTKPDTYQVISRGRCLEISQHGNHFTFHCPKEDLDGWLSYFDLEADYQKYIDSIRPKDTYLQAAARSGMGIRILRQDPWEMIISFMISQQKTIPKIKEAIEDLSRRYGSRIVTAVPGQETESQEVESQAAESPAKVGTTKVRTTKINPAAVDRTDLWAFPSPCQLSQASLEDLKEMKLGYRAKYIYQVCQDVCCGKLDLALLDTMDYKSAMAYLTGFYGIGVKVANCICLFGLHHIDAFPVDTWIQKILLKEYYRKKYDKIPKNRLYETMVQDNFKAYKGYAGIMQQYIFFYERVTVQGKH